MGKSPPQLWKIAAVGPRGEKRKEEKSGKKKGRKRKKEKGRKKKRKKEKEAKIVN